MRSAVPCAVAVLLAAQVAAAEATSGKLSRAQGKVWLQPMDGSEMTANLGMQVAPGTKIRTGPDGLAEVTFADGSVLQVQAASTVQLSKNKREVKKSSIVLFFGRVWSKVVHTTDETTYEVKTPNAVCGVRGTAFTASVADDGTARVKVSEGKVEVQGDSTRSEVEPGQQVDADEEGVGSQQPTQSDAQNQAWQKERQERLNSQSERIVAKIKSKIMSRKDKLEALRKQQEPLLEARKQAEARAQRGDAAAVDEVRQINQQLAPLMDAIADLGDEAASQFGIVDHFADLVGDPRFSGINRKTLQAEANSLRRVKADFDQMVADGTNISMQAMDEMLRDMHGGKHKSLKEKSGSSAKDLFDE